MNIGIQETKQVIQNQSNWRTAIKWCMTINKNEKLAKNKTAQVAEFFWQTLKKS